MRNEHEKEEKKETEKTQKKETEKERKQDNGTCEGDGEREGLAEGEGIG